MIKYIIASIEGIRHDLAPQYNGKYGKVYHYGGFDLIVHTCGDWPSGEYEEAYKEISDYCEKVNNEFKGNQYYNGWMYAEMLTPNERNEYNNIRCKLFHTWLVDKIITADEIIVSKVNVCEKNLHDRINVYDNPEQVMKIARAISHEMLQSIHIPGDYIHNCYMKSSENIFLPNQPIFELGWILTYSIQIIDKHYASAFKIEENEEKSA